MRSMLVPMKLLLALSCASTLSACATDAPTTLVFPSVVELKPPAKPEPTIDILSSAKASADYNSAIEAWGDAMALQIGRVCTWAKDNGMKSAPC